MDIKELLKQLQKENAGYVKLNIEINNCSAMCEPVIEAYNADEVTYAKMIFGLESIIKELKTQCPNLKKIRKKMNITQQIERTERYIKGNDVEC